MVLCNSLLQCVPVSSAAGHLLRTRPSWRRPRRCPAGSGALRWCRGAPSGSDRSRPRPGFIPSRQVRDSPAKIASAPPKCGQIPSSLAGGKRGRRPRQSSAATPRRPAALPDLQPLRCASLELDVQPLERKSGRVMMGLHVSVSMDV